MKLIRILSLLSFLSACNKDSNDDPLYLGYDYYPLEIGNSWIYEGDSVVYNSFFNDTTYKIFQLKETISNIFLDNAGDSTYQVNVYKRSNEHEDWIKTRTFPLNKRASRLERIEENQRYVRLIFPIKDNKSWDGNAYNAMEAQTYYYQNLDTPFLTFDSTIRVTQSELVSIVGDYHAFEIYQKGTGMIYKELFDVSVLTDNTTGAIDTNKVNGYEYRLKLIDVE